MDEIFPDLFRIKIPLPKSPLKYLNSYVICSSPRNLVIDTGLNRDECFDTMMRSLKDLKIDLKKTDFFITHIHADHFGLVSRLASDANLVYFNKPEKKLMDNWKGFGSMLHAAARHGFPEDLLQKALTQHPGYKYGLKKVPDLTVVEDGDTVTCGQYQFTCVQTPGHTWGHTCLYDPAKKILVAGDHVLIDITPNIQCWSDSENPLQNYMKSLDKVLSLEVEQVLPGHRRLFSNLDRRVQELKDHHETRLEEIVSILSNERRQNAYQVAAQMTWDIESDSWDQFPTAQKWFASGEAIAHLRYLEEEQVIDRIIRDEKVFFQISNSPA